MSLLAKNSTSDAIYIRLRQGKSWSNDVLQLNRASFAGLNTLEITTSEANRALVFRCSGIHDSGIRNGGKKLDLVVALRSGLLELYDEETGAVVDASLIDSVPSIASDDHIVIPPPLSATSRQVSIRLVMVPTAPVWKKVLLAGKTYSLRLSATGGEVSCTSDETVVVERMCTDQVRFKVYDDPAPPTVHAMLRLQPNDGTCNLSGNPPFKFIIDLTSSANEPVTVCTQHTPFGAYLPVRGLNCVDQLILCVDMETNEEVDFPAQFMCFDENPDVGFPADEHFLELPSRISWRFEYTLEELTNSTLGGLESLEAGRQYRVQLAKSATDGFGTWMYGKKADLLKGTDQEKEQRCKPDPRGRGRIDVKQANEPVQFTAVAQ